MIVDNTTYQGSAGDDRVVTFSQSTGKLYTRDGQLEIQQKVYDPTEFFRMNSEEVEQLRSLLKDYERLKQLVKDHFPEDAL